MRGLLFVMLVCAMFIFGCNGQAPASQQPAPGGIQPASGGTPPSQNPPGATKPSVGETPPSPPAQNPPAQQAPSSAIDEFSKLVGMKGTAQWMAEYNARSTAMGQVQTYVMTQYIKGTDRYRADTAVSGYKSRAFGLSGEFYSCTSMDGASWTCYKLGNQNSDNTTKSREDVEKNPVKYNLEADGTMEVAGSTASCFKATIEQGTARYCYSPLGILLYYKMSGTGRYPVDFEMTATKFSTDVPDSVFNLPAEAKTMPVAGGSMGGGAGSTGSSGSGSGTAGSSGDVCAYCNYLSGSQKEQCLASCGSAG